MGTEVIWSKSADGMHYSRAWHCRGSWKQLTGKPHDDAAADRPKRFEEVAGFEVPELASRHPLAILPLGSLEFHGPHNPLGSDFIIISGIAERVAARTNGLLFPTLAFTQCPAHTAHFPGTHVDPSRGDDACTLRRHAAECAALGLSQNLTSERTRRQHRTRAWRDCSGRG